MKVSPMAFAVSLLATSLLTSRTADAAVTAFEAAGATAAAVQPTVDAFRAALGGANNGVGNPKPDGRREINWDAVPAQFLDSLPPAFFNTNSARGLVMSTPGTRLKVSGDSGTPSFLMKDVTAQGWGETEFATFSPQKLFAPIGSDVTDIVFFVPGTATRGTVSGFGAVFVDVDVANASKVEAFDAAGRLLFSRTVLQAGVASKGLSFLGAVAGAGERIARVRLTSGSAQIDAPFQEPPPDGVALDDFIYGEPQALAEPLGISAWLGAATRGPGANGSQWRTDVALLNATGFAASWEVRLRIGGTVAKKSGSVAAGAQAILSDVVGELWGDGTGPLEIVSDVPLAVGFRVYNEIPSSATCFPAATFAFAGDAFQPQDVLGSGETAVLGQLTEESSARTNVALTNTGTGPATATVTLLDAAGAVVGSYDVSLAAGEWKQEGRPFLNRFGRSNVRGGSARVRITTGTAVVAYATVIDNATNDPSYVPGKR